MGTFMGHIAPGLAFTFLGLWHIFNTIKDYKLEGPSNFKSRVWHQFRSPLCNIKYLELLLIFCFSIFAIVFEIIDYPLFDLSFKLNNFEHATIFLHLAIYSGVTLAAELTGAPDMFSGLVGILATSVFGQELFLLHFHSADHVGPEGHYHWLLQLIVSVSLLSSLAVTSFPENFPLALVRSIAVLLQGCWFLDMALMLWVPRLIVEGCFGRPGNGDDMHGAVVCTTEEASLKMKALANLQFSWIMAAILIFTAFLCLTPAAKRGQGSGCPKYEKLQSSRSMEVNQIFVAADSLKQPNLTPP
ncbi:hypothetical protein H6P81_004366 [Aristolochia fimbriata]|uniref:Transmembrane protein 45B n=1 Tax=Aristolochia fimbriata TaxID=158543 RepID=A0AAV7FHZ7_ARIFI|nr:hypothetical protein H6P81_004366 [Aristolochia fimbriata]